MLHFTLVCLLTHVNLYDRSIGRRLRRDGVRSGFFHTLECSFMCIVHIISDMIAAHPRACLHTTPREHMHTSSVDLPGK